MGINITIDGTVYENIDVITVGGKTLYLAGSSGSGGSSGGTSGGGTGTTGLITNGLVSYFDLRNCEYTDGTSSTPTIIKASQGNGQLYTWAAGVIAEQSNKGLKFALSRSFQYNSSTGTTPTDLGTAMTVIMLTYGDIPTHGFLFENLGVRWAFKPKYLNTSGSEAYAEHRSGANFNSDSKEDYNFCVYRVNGNILTEIMDTSTTTYNGSEISNFASWLSTINGFSVNEAQADGKYFTAMAVYDRALSDVEIEEMRAFMATLEVA